MQLSTSSVVIAEEEETGLPGYTVTALNHICTGVVKTRATSNILNKVRRIILAYYSFSLTGLEMQAVKRLDTLQTSKLLHLEVKPTGNEPEMSMIIPHYRRTTVYKHS